jgi:hypothetical protein
LCLVSRAIHSPSRADCCPGHGRCCRQGPARLTPRRPHARTGDTASRRHHGRVIHLRPTRAHLLLWRTLACPSLASLPRLACLKPCSGSRLNLDCRACPASQDGRTPLYASSYNGHSGLVDRLIAARAMVDAADKVLPRTRPRPMLAQETPPTSSTTVIYL